MDHFSSGKFHIGDGYGVSLCRLLKIDKLDIACALLARLHGDDVGVIGETLSIPVEERDDDGEDRLLLLSLTSQPDTFAQKGRARRPQQGMRERRKTWPSKEMPLTQVMPVHVSSFVSCGVMHPMRLLVAVIWPLPASILIFTTGEELLTTTSIYNKLHTCYGSDMLWMTGSLASLG
jgi:hypothetical protein